MLSADLSAGGRERRGGSPARPSARRDGEPLAGERVLARLGASAAAWITVAALAAGSLVWVRRATGGLAPPGGAGPLTAAVLVGATLALAVDRLAPQARLRRFAVRLGLVLAVAALLPGGVSTPGGGRGTAARLATLPALAAAVAVWLAPLGRRRPAPRVPGRRATPRPAPAGPDHFRRAAAPDRDRRAAAPDQDRRAAAPDRDRRAAAPDQDRRAAAPDQDRRAAAPDRFSRAAAPTPADTGTPPPGIAPSTAGAAADTPLTAEGVFRQRLERYLSPADATEVVRGRIVLSVAAGSRSAIGHVGFCPPFHQQPQVEVGTSCEAVEAAIVAAEILPWGVRVECRLDEPADEAIDIPVDIVARAAIEAGDPPPPAPRTRDL